MRPVDYRPNHAPEHGLLGLTGELSEVHTKGDERMPYAIRSYQNEDVSFLWDVLYQSIYIPDGEERPGREILADPAIAKYLTHWGQDTDIALLAVDEHGTRLGATWTRVWHSADHAWGYVDDATPVVGGMAVRAEYRGQGLGGQLLRAIGTHAQQAGFSALSLSVDPRNEVALQVYRRHGYQFVFEDTGGSWTMKKVL